MEYEDQVNPIKKGRVPDTCLLDGLLVLALVLRAEDPCGRCNHDRDVCKGRPRTPVAP